MSQLTRRGPTFSGAGVPLAVLQFAATRLGEQAVVTPNRDDPATQRITIGAAEGWLHDGCFFAFEKPSTLLQEAVVAGLRELHTYYLGGAPAPTPALAMVHDRLRDGFSVRTRSRPSRIEVSAFAVGASWLGRLVSRRMAFKVE
jgi:hypothetical protein